MKNKHDMYINYKDIYKKYGKIKKRKRLIPIIVILVLIGVGAFCALQWNVMIGKEQRIVQDERTPQINENPTDIPEITAIPTPSTIPTPSAIPSPTETPAPTVTAVTPEDAVAVSLDSLQPPESVKVKGIYVAAGTAGSSSIQDLLELAQATEVNAMVIDVKDDFGRITYSMESKTAVDIGAIKNTIPDITDLVTSCKEKDIYLIARIVAFKDPYLASQRTDLAVKNKDGTLYQDKNNDYWVNPYKREVWDYLIEIASQAAADGFDEIQFDYIRFATGDGITKADFGEDAKTKSKEEIITEFTKYAYQRIKPLGVFISADVFGAIINSTIDSELVGQNYVEMSKHLDYICPMIYPSHFGDGSYGVQYPDLEPFEIISKVMEASKIKLSVIPEGEHKAIVRPWLQDFTASWIKQYKKYGADEIREQIDGVYSAGYEEWLLWNSRCSYTEDGLKEE
ncbi:MAG: putative glycoside hydrolase [Herbinix sp.]|nr:putative glycoside hydrolase [Herbinix sp.]